MQRLAHSPLVGLTLPFGHVIKTRFVLDAVTRVFLL
jgi:hypothetical protein